ncbi:MAG: imidazole glycerol phosphate synthase subunit HisH [Chloroflexota bacterium]|nr:imidazole glycerol phosphate synthase subunit HisH [Chloroflexota bacterium]
MTRPLRVAVADYGAGNLVSIGRALETVGAVATIVRDPAGLRSADALVVPGVGAAAPAMARLERYGLAAPIRTWVEAGRPFLGICLGLQLLYDGSDEDGAQTLGLLGGRTVALRGAPTLPHIGWNQVERRSEHPLLTGIPDGADLYFVHSFVVAPTDRTTIVAETVHGTPFPSVIASGNVLGVQFHPERSGVDGLRILANFVGWATPAVGTARRPVAVVGGQR